MTLDPIAVLFVLQTQEEGVPDNREMLEEEEKGVEERKRKEKKQGGAQPREKTYNLQQTLGKYYMNFEVQKNENADTAEEKNNLQKS